MTLSYDIFNLVDFPIIVTDKNFIIIYKNNTACEYFGKLRKRSKITKYLADFAKDMDFSVNSEAEFETGTLIKRALVFAESDFVVFLFLSAMQLENYAAVAGHIKERFAGNFLGFCFSAYREYSALQAMSAFEKANVPERAYADLLALIRILGENPSFMKKEYLDLAEIVSYTAHRAGAGFRALGLKLYLAEISDKTRAFCCANIALDDFLFVIFRLIYSGFKFSADGNLLLSIDYLYTNHADICASVRTTLKKSDVQGKNFSSLLKMLPEFAFEFDLLEKYSVFEQNTLSYELENSFLKLHFKVKCDCGDTLFIRSESPEKRKNRLARAVSTFICEAKSLLSKNYKTSTK